MWLMLQQETAEDFVIATGQTHTVRELCERAFACTGVDLDWQGEGVEEKGVDRKTGKILVEVDPKYFRPAEVDLLIGDSSKARKKLGWSPQVTFEELVRIMVEADLSQEAR
jgi:GDPmannose 4,6-dehydratase